MSDEKDLVAVNLPDCVVVTSASAIKVNTVKKFLGELFPQRHFTVVGVKAILGINEQPVGDEAEEGAFNRICSAEAIVEAQEPGIPRAYVSIENGIFEIGTGTWEDKAVAVIKLPDGRTFSAISPRGVLFPKEAVDAALAKAGGFKDNTAASIIAEIFAAKGQQIDKQDPHSVLTNGEFSREEQMMSAISAALLKVVVLQRNNT